MENRKDDHIRLALKYYNDNKVSDFDNVKFIYNSFSSISLNDIDISTTIGDIKLNTPFFINAMSGGSKKSKEVNKKLAEVAKACDLAIASGSLSAAIKDSSVSDTFSIIREVNKEGIVFANLGAEYSSKEANTAIDILSADAIQIHLNPLQELIMLEGDRDFSSYTSNIKEIVENVESLVIVKEVGFGMSRDTIKTLIDLNVKVIDISGSGGTNFAKIEDNRREYNRYDYLYDFSISTVNSLLEAYAYKDQVDIIASGGIRNPLDIVKSLALGAKAVGMSALVLNLVETYDVLKTIEIINEFKEDIKKIMLLLNAKNIKELQKKELILFNNVLDFAKARNINYLEFSNRNV